MALTYLTKQQIQLYPYNWMLYFLVDDASDISDVFEEQETMNRQKEISEQAVKAQVSKVGEVNVVSYHFLRSTQTKQKFSTLRF